MDNKQVNKLGADINNLLSVEMKTLFASKRKELLESDEYKKLLDSKRKGLDELNVKVKEYNKLQDELTNACILLNVDKYNVFNGFNIAHCEIDTAAIEEAIETSFLYDKYLNNGSIYDLLEILSTKIQAVLSTLDIQAYDKIVSLVKENVKVNDLFENRQLYITRT